MGQVRLETGVHDQKSGKCDRDRGLMFWEVCSPGHPYCYALGVFWKINVSGCGSSTDWGEDRQAKGCLFHFSCQIIDLTFCPLCYLQVGNVSKVNKHHWVSLVSNDVA